MDIIAKFGKYELMKNDKGVYFVCHCGCWISCGYCKNDTEAISHFTNRLKCNLEDLTIV